MPTLWLVLFSATLCQGTVLGLALVVKSRKSNSYHWLGAFVLCFTLLLGYYLLFWLKVTPKLPTWLGLLQYLTLLLGPLLWMHLSAQSQLKQKTQWLHFLPFILACLLFLVFAGSSLWPIMGLALIALQLLQNLSYSIAILHTNKPKNSVYGYLFLIYSISFSIYYLLVWTGRLVPAYDYAVSLSMAICVYYIGYQFIQLPAEQRQTIEKYEHSGLSVTMREQLIKRLDEHMQNNSPYLDGHLKLSDLAESLNLSAHHLSEAVNTMKQQNFNDYVNTWRIAKAKQLIKDCYLQNRNEKLLAIALESGFNNKTSFLNAFKKHEGISPSLYRERIGKAQNRENMIGFAE